MANNFKIDADYYVSTAGDNNNSGTSKDAPIRTISRLEVVLSNAPDQSYTVAIGTGVYNTFETNIIDAGALRGDETCVFRRDGDPLTLQADGGSFEINNFIFTGHSLVTIGDDASQGVASVNCIYYGNVLFIKNNNDNLLLHGSKFINIDVEFSAIGAQINSCMFINTTGYVYSGTNDFAGDLITGEFFDNNYVDFNSTVPWEGHPAGFGNSNIQGIIKMEGNSYAIQDQLTGTPQDNGYSGGVDWLNESNLTSNGYTGTIDGWDDAVSTCINRAPKFNNVDNNDFTIQSDSPLYNKGNGININNGNLGNARLGIGYHAGSDTEIDDADKDNITGEVDLEIGSSGDIGSLLLRPMNQPSNILMPLQGVDYVGALTFNVDEAGGTATNQNVPDITNHDDGDPGRNPNRLSYELRWSNNENEPAGENEWNNNSSPKDDGIISNGDFIEMEWNTKPLIDSNGRGNAHPEFDLNNNEEINCRWYQLRVKLRNNYTA